MPSTEQLALWAAIRANPLDDTPRLVYADWLQENGDEPRADFIRLQCQIAQLPNDHKTRRKVLPGLEHRERVLLTANREWWLEPVLQLFRRSVMPDYLKAQLQGGQGRLRWNDFRRGFIWGLRLGLDSAYRLVTAATPLEPMDGLMIVESARVSRQEKKLTAVAGWEDARCFQLLSLQHANDEDARLIARSRLTGLRSLSLWDGSITDAGAAELAGWQGGMRLRTLILHSNRIGDAGADTLANSPHLAGVEQLDLRRNPISHAARRRLVARFGGAVLLPDD
jgi:uncharacterized protein (TIGR02996 family)